MESKEPTAPAPAPAPVAPAQEAPREVKKPPPPPTPEEQLQRAFNVSGVWQWLDNQLVACQKALRVTLFKAFSMTFQ